MMPQVRTLEDASNGAVLGSAVQVCPEPPVCLVNVISSEGAELGLQLGALGIEGLENAQSETIEDLACHRVVGEQESGLNELTEARPGS
jgi:hypothetical protein